MNAMPTLPTDFGKLRWQLLCGCAADEYDNRVWCTRHAHALVQATDERDALRKALKWLLAASTDANNLQHAGLTVPDAVWSAMYQAANEARTALAATPGGAP